MGYSFEKLFNEFRSADADCWLWGGARSTNGRATHNKVSVRRIVYEKEVGEIPYGMVVVPTCGHRLCFNPRHLILETKDKGVTAAIRKNRRIPREIRVLGDIAVVPLSAGYQAIIDAADAELVSGRQWTAKPHGNVVYAYAERSVAEQRSGLPRRVYLHRLISPPPEGMVIDHEDGDGLNNRRVNLRHCTHAENMRNRRPHRGTGLGIKGVKQVAGGYSATIRADGVTHQLGVFYTADDAADAYDEAAKRLHGRFFRPSRG